MWAALYPIHVSIEVDLWGDPCLSNDHRSGQSFCIICICIFVDSCSLPSLPLGVVVLISFLLVDKYDFQLNSFQCDGVG